LSIASFLRYKAHRPEFLFLYDMKCVFLTRNIRFHVLNFQTHVRLCYFEATDVKFDGCVFSTLKLK